MKRDDPPPVGASGRAPCGHAGEVAIGNFVSCKICTDREKRGTKTTRPMACPPEPGESCSHATTYECADMHGIWCNDCGMRVGAHGDRHYTMTLR